MNGSATAGSRERSIRAILDDLIEQRRGLRRSDVDEGLRQANRLSIVYWQWQLSRTLADHPERPEAASKP